MQQEKILKETLAAKVAAEKVLQEAQAANEAAAAKEAAAIAAMDPKKIVSLFITRKNEKIFFS